MQFELNYEEINEIDFEKILYITEKKSGLKAIIALHSTHLGPAIGGTRIYPYASFEDALFDVKRLAIGMTHKAAGIEAGLGGGKSVIFADPKKGLSKDQLHAFAHAVNLFEGKYYCAEDSGSTPQQMAIINEKTDFVVGLEKSGCSGNPSVHTAYGVFYSMKATDFYLNTSTSLEGKKVVIQGAGVVGTLLAELLYWEGAEIVVADLDNEKVENIVQKFGATAVDCKDVLYEPCDILAPCAMGNVFSNNIDRIRAKMVVGAANNQLNSPLSADQFASRGIIYAPDFIVNSGGLINAAFEVQPQGYSPKKARDQVVNIYNRLIALYEIAKKSDITPLAVAQRIIEHRLKYALSEA